MDIYARGGPFPPYDSLPATVMDFHAVANEYYLNLTPFQSLLDQKFVGTPSFKVVSDRPMPKSVPLNGAISSTGTTAFVVDDASVYDVNDVVQALAEYLLVTAVNAGTNTLTVTRGYAGTTALSSIADRTPVYIVGNSRSGAAVNIEAMSLGQVITSQWLQTFQHAYSTGGATATNTGFVSEHGLPLDRDRWNCLRRTTFDIEDAIAYGRVVAGDSAPTALPAMAGVRQLCASNRVTSPVNGAAYKTDDFIRDTFQAACDNGGAPNRCFVSTDWLSHFAKWKSINDRARDGGKHDLDYAVDSFEVSFMPGVKFTAAPRFRKGTAFLFDDTEVRLRVKRAMHDKPRGSRGDAYEGDVIGEYAIQVDNEAHHVWLEGVTNASAS